VELELGRIEICASRWPTAAACATPAALSGMSVRPWMRRLRFHSVSPWRTK
jgi:hypothetical protein